VVGMYVFVCVCLVCVCLCESGACFCVVFCLFQASGLFPSPLI
jgi:hypothetical protein